MRESSDPKIIISLEKLAKTLPENVNIEYQGSVHSWIIGEFHHRRTFFIGIIISITIEIITNLQ